MVAYFRITCIDSRDGEENRDGKKKKNTLRISDLFGSDGAEEWTFKYSGYF